MSIDEIIRSAGGTRAIVARAARTRHPITVWAVHKWRSRGVNETYWPLLCRMVPGLTVETIHHANMALDRSVRRRRRRIGRVSCVA